MLWKDQIREWKDEAREDGLAEGAKKKAIETARKLLEKNIPAETIAECTELSLEEVNKLNKGNS